MDARKRIQLIKLSEKIKRHSKVAMGMGIVVGMAIKSEKDRGSA